MDEIREDIQEDNKDSVQFEASSNKKISKRTIKNVVMILVIASMILAILFTCGFAGGHRGEMKGDKGNKDFAQMPQQEQSVDSSGATASGDNDSATENVQPPTDNGQGMDGNTHPPTDNEPGTDGNAQPQTDNGQGTDSNVQPPTNYGGKPGNMNNPLARMGIIRIVLLILESLLLGATLVYLILSGMNKRTVKETLSERKRAIAFAVATLLVGCGVSAAGILLPVKILGNMHGGPGQVQGGQNASDSSEVEASAVNVIDGESVTLNKEYSSTDADQSVILVKNSGTLTSTGASIKKTGGDGSNTDNCDFYGINAGLLVNSKSKATVKNADISTSANLSNAVFCTGEGSEINISDSTISTTGERSCRGLDATYGGIINADNVTVSTEGNSCAAVATDRGEGTIKVDNSNLSTEGTGSPVIYSTGTISIAKTKGTAEGSQCVVVEGKNSATVTDSAITSSGGGNRGDVDVCGVMLYQSMSGDADEGTSIFTAKNSSLAISKDSNYYRTAPMFFVTNTDAEINLNNTELTFGSGILLSAKGTNQWGNTDSNGGKVKLVADNQNLSGDITADSISTVSLKLRNGSTYKGAINSDKKAKSVKLVVSKDSQLVLTGDTYVSSFEDEDSTYSNIDFNGHKLFVDGKAISA